MPIRIFGMRRRYKVKGLPEIFRRVADKIPKKDNPTTEYCCEDLEGALRLLENELNITITRAHIKHDY